MITGHDSEFSRFDPHGYRPVSVHPDSLSPEESREALLDYFRERAAQDIQRSFLNMSRTELKTISPRPRSRASESPSESERMEAFSRSMDENRLRYIQKKYKVTGRVWYGDGPPPWAR